MTTPRDVRELQELLAAHAYLADTGLATALFLAWRLPQPLLLEGEPGVGKSELARTLAASLGVPFIRLQCYEGVDSREALYEWNYLQQLLELRKQELEQRSAGPAADARDAQADPRAGARAEARTGAGPDGLRRGAADLNLFAERFLQPRPLLRALRESQEKPAVLLIDEIDRADESFEAFLLEFLADFAITIPELGTVRAGVPPLVIITSNRTRELHDALKRRCLYHWVEYPSLAEEIAIVRTRAPEVSPELAAAVVNAVRWLRGLDLQKPPGIAESISWARAVRALGHGTLTPATADQTLGVVVKNRDDVERVRATAYDGLAG
jgi:MoxR-like ATPase